MTKPKAIASYSKLVEAAAEKFRCEVLPEGNVIQGDLASICDFVLNSEAVKQLIEQIAREASLSVVRSQFQTFEDWFKAFMGGEDE